MGYAVFTNVHVFDGASPELLADRHVVVEDGTIRAVGEGAPPTGAGLVLDGRGRTLMPGLIDLHVHIWCADVNIGRAARRSSEYLAAFAIRSLEDSLDRGFTTIRDAGGAAPSYADAIEDGLIRGPRFYPSGRVMSQTGGHADWRLPSDEDWPDDMAQNRLAALVDSPDAMRRAVRLELARGARQIKLMLSGGVSSPTDPLDKIQFSDAEIAAAVEEAARRGTYVFAHCHPLNSIQKALETGIRTIEHASFLDAPTAQAIAAKGAYVVPTLVVAKALGDTGRELGFPEVSLRKLAGLLDAMMTSLEHLKRAGAKLGYGTDLLGPHQSLQSLEFDLRREVQSAHEILVSATSMGAEILQEEGRLGVVQPDAHADLLLVDGNPLDDIGLLSQGGAKLPVIMKAGRLHKNTL